MTLTTTRAEFLLAASSAARLLSDPAVATRWDQPSALQDFSIRGLAGHLALQILYVQQVLRAAPPTGPVATLDDHYANATWIEAPLDDPSNVSTRENGEEVSVSGPAAVADRAAHAVAELQAALQLELDERVIAIPWADRRLRLDDFLLTRMMEIAVHSDDLAVSVGVPTPVLGPNTLGPVLLLLTKLSVRRHGALALLRALSRRERAPETIAAF